MEELVGTFFAVPKACLVHTTSTEEDVAPSNARPSSPIEDPRSDSTPGEESGKEPVLTHEQTPTSGTKVIATSPLHSSEGKEPVREQTPIFGTKADAPLPLHSSKGT
ncbi:hypothetical protein CYMTET_27889 [Cymbomonas tetramitiformis]|uniref:Uncharacterized protein n=1 Tax=Cymbomonas tetramitiformis TaxID=36881 RepID=A0AAE0KWG9_9CHLO|nr:hypothetical protein CYMTET_27889 [Cymbomonas tetramitiformis]